MKFTKEMKNRLERATSKEEVNGIIAETKKGAESAGVILDDADLEQASGGAYGSLGMNGMNGGNGMNGMNGMNGKNGSNGMNGMNGSNTSGKGQGGKVGLLNLPD
ncbi:MAG: hypothetical protein IJI24_05635 [Lachnospiraceae bacterium]|nr:hypothetical protein [Lachnospiraceae bacterium]